VLDRPIPRSGFSQKMPPLQDLDAAAYET